jgi:hypothetical protein
MGRGGPPKGMKVVIVFSGRGAVGAGTALEQLKPLESLVWNELQEPMSVR